ncbi:MAG: carotenoid oxygenase family protein [Myxococcota bacterium]
MTNDVTDPITALANSYASVTEEVDQTLEGLEGRVPEGLRGVLFRNGPGKVEVEGTPQLHPFDGDGMISRFAFTPEGVRYRNRYVRTREFLDERRTGRMRYRGFGTNVPGGLPSNFLRMRFKNAANTSVVRHGGRLLALWEAGMPHALDSETLATFGRFDFGGALRTRLPLRLLTPERPFSAHPTVCPRTGELFNFGIMLGPGPRLVSYRGAPDGEELEVRTHTLARTCFMHDFALTERFSVYFATPVHFDVLPALAGLQTPVESLRRAEEPTEILIEPREGGPLRSFRAPSSFFLFHFFGAWEQDGAIHVLGCRYAEFEGEQTDARSPEALRAADIARGEPTHWRIDLGAGTVEETFLEAPRMELPIIDPRRSTQRFRVAWGSCQPESDGPSIYNGLARLDLDEAASPGCAVRKRDFGADLPGEPVFVPRTPEAPEGVGWLLSLVYRAREHRSELWILNAETLETTARFALPHNQARGVAF